jgi:hypothetical protein
LNHNVETKQCFTPLGIVSKLLEKYNGMSYDRYPVYLKDFSDHNKLQFRLSYGEKGEPRELIKFANSNASIISQIFARTYYESGDLDYFISTPFTTSEYDEIKKPCRYGFDEVQFKLTKGEKVNSILYDTDSNCNRVKLQGEMYSISNLIEQEHSELVINPTENYRSVHGYADNKFKTQKSELFYEILNKSDEVTFLYRGKTIHRKIRTSEFIKQNPVLSKEPRMLINFKHANEMNKGYFDFYSCGWKNCINDEYLKYLEKEKNSTET